MATAPRASDLVSGFLDGVQVAGGAGIDRRNLSIWSVLGAGMSAMAVRANLVAAETFDASLLERCTDTTLDAFVASHSDGVVSRDPGRQAYGTSTFARPTTGAGGGTIYKDTQIRVPYNGKSYVFLVSADTPIANSALSVTVPVIAQQTGAASNVGTISSSLALPGLPAALFDTTLVPSSIAVAGGADAEEDDDLKTRFRLWSRGKRGGVAAAVAYGALTAGVKRVVLAFVRDPHIGAIAAVYVGDVNWQSTPTMRDSVAAALEDWKAWGTCLDVRGMAQVDVPVTATLRMVQPVAFYDVSALRTAGAQAVIDYFDRRKDPYAYDLAMMQGRLARVDDEVSTVELRAPTLSVPSPLSPSVLKAAGALPVTLNRYRTNRSIVTVDVEGPI